MEVIMLGSIFKVFFGNIFRLLGIIALFVGIFTFLFATPSYYGIIIFVIGILLISAGSVFKRS
jgi:uncharacterized membrane protein